ncbi:MAG: hypothetical protein J7641_12280 [Cyanobacteria bacterium SID2]|nr:hypothetical protein [Cyanobacteria bacterium SID2]MBP0006034.1 hypothetical protein [Cyanobacteria bacterium SBC]
MQSLQIAPSVQSETAAMGFVVFEAKFVEGFGFRSMAGDRVSPRRMKTSRSRSSALEMAG